MKPIKDTKLGEWLKEKAPKVLDKVGDLLPDNGVFGIVKNLLDLEPDLTPEERKQAALYAHELEIEYVKDVQNARSREIDFIKATGHMDYMMWFLAFAAIGANAFVIWALVFHEIPKENREILIGVFGMLDTILISIYSYYWGSSAGSRVKDMRR